MSVPFIYVNGILNLVLKGKPVQITSEHPSFNLIKSSLKDGTEDDLFKLYNTSSSVEAFVGQAGDKRTTVKDGEVFFDGKPVHSVITNRIKDFMVEGLPFDHLLKFMDNLALNPSYSSQQELFDFLQHRSLPITEDGFFLAYKAVKPDFSDKYTGTISNTVGTIVEVERSSVDDNRGKGCSAGLHCGALDYVNGYKSDGDRMIIVKVHPRDVVSVPKDCAFQKLRTCRYEVIAEFKEELKAPLYTEKAEQVSSKVNIGEYDWQWADNQQDEEEFTVYGNGYDSFYDGEPISNNPYPAGSQDYEDWENGWKEAEYDDLSEDPEEDDSWVEDENYDDSDLDDSDLEDDSWLDTDEDDLEDDDLDDNNDYEGLDEEEDDYDPCEDCPDTVCESNKNYVNPESKENSTDNGNAVVFGVKPSGRRYWNKRNSSGKFSH